MEEIRRIIESKAYLTMTDEEMKQTARKEFCKFGDDELKTEFLTILFSRQSPDLLSISPEKCARLLVESGTFEGWQ